MLKRSPLSPSARTESVCTQPPALNTSPRCSYGVIEALGSPSRLPFFFFLHTRKLNYTHTEPRTRASAATRTALCALVGSGLLSYSRPYNSPLVPIKPRVVIPAGNSRNITPQDTALPPRQVSLPFPRYTAYLCPGGETWKSILGWMLLQKMPGFALGGWVALLEHPQ